jgi:hypothetical protein
MTPRQTLVPRSLWMPDARVAAGDWSQSDWDQYLKETLKVMDQFPEYR